MSMVARGFFLQFALYSIAEILGENMEKPAETPFEKLFLTGLRPDRTDPMVVHPTPEGASPGGGGSRGPNTPIHCGKTTHPTGSDISVK